MTLHRLRRPLAVAAAALAFTTVHAAAAGADAPANDEIDHLLHYVAVSSCTFVRNGTEYPADKASEHLASKYHFVGARIASAEDFIKYLATQSSITGEPYHVKCGKTDALSGAWLTAELHRYRKTAHQQQVSR